MKRLLVWILALLAWEFLVLKKKDANFKKQVQKRSWVEKLSYIFDRLISFNQELIWDAKSWLESLDKETLSQHVEKTKARVDAEYWTLKESLLELQWSLDTMSKKNIKEIRAQLKTRLVDLEASAKKLWIDLDKKYWWKKKFTELKKLYETVEKKA